MSKKLKGNLLLFLVAFIWGSAFVAQSSGMDYVGPYTYNMTRNVLAFLFLIPVIWFMERGRSKSAVANMSDFEDRLVDQFEEQHTQVLDADAAASAMASLNENANTAPKGQAQQSFWEVIRPNRITLIGGICCGLALSVASTFQQVGITMTTAGKSGFITALYIIMVPIMSVVLGKKIPKIIWFCASLAIVGFYLLCVTEDFTISTGDVLTLICAICFSIHIIVIDYFTSKNVDGVKMSCIQFGVASIVLTPLMFLMEDPSMHAILSAWVTIGYAGILSSGVAYTLQIVAQKDTDPTTATLIMSLESVFAALSGWVILHEVLSAKELLGCAIVLVAVVLAQVPLPTRAPKAAKADKIADSPDAN